MRERRYVVADQQQAWFDERGLIPVVTRNPEKIHGADPAGQFEAICPKGWQHHLPVRPATRDELDRLPACRGCTKANVERLVGHRGGASLAEAAQERGA